MDNFDEQEKQQEAKSTGQKVLSTFGGIGSMIYKLRSILLSIPVVIAAVVLAMRNSRLLPETVGINLLESGEYQWLVARNVAVLGPLAITALCLLMVFCSRRVVYPWLISIFSLAIPFLLWITNVFPA